jgi:hypothetical protein
MCIEFSKLLFRFRVGLPQCANEHLGAMKHITLFPVEKLLYLKCNNEENSMLYG